MIINEKGEQEEQFQKAYAFEDVLLVPQYSEIESRKEVDLTNNLGPVTLTLPVISSPMDTVTESAMAIALSEAGGLGVLHRYNSISEQAEMANKVLSQHWAEIDNMSGGYIADIEPEDNYNVAAAIGTTGDYLERATALFEQGVNVFCLDVAHGHHSLVKNALESLKKTFGNNAHIMAGNVATKESVDDLADWGADSVRIGIGGGSICSTRIQTGHGMPTFQSIVDCARTDRKVKLIADGGIKTSGDIVKALAAGAHAVMLGSLLAGTDESPGDIYENRRGEKYKAYRGMASKEAQIDWHGRFSSLEGISTTIPYKGKVDLILDELRRGIRSGLSYSGCRTIEEFHRKARFVQQTPAGQIESSTHILRR
jgi:IMP dehydrogenase|tara:strand:+ start:988 stop:2094 length:1107 start_codon:yes stop_codon:yes gene_type:complete